MKSLITSTLFTFSLLIGLGFQAEAHRLFDAVPEHVQFQNKLIEDVLTINTDTSVDFTSSQNFHPNEIIKSNKKGQENLQTAVVESSIYGNAKNIVQTVSLPTPLIKDMVKQVYVSSYKVDYKGGTQYFPSSVQGEAFMKQLNNDYQNNLIPNPGNVNGYYTSCLVQELFDYSRWHSKALLYK
jgi:hypothetical protein